MIDLSIYELLEKIVQEKEDKLRELQRMCGCEEENVKFGINSLQSVVRSSVVEEQQQDPSYSRITYGKNGYTSIKPGNLKFDINSMISIVSNVPGVMEKEEWAILLAVFSIVAELKRARVKLSPVMGMIVKYLHKNYYTKRGGKKINETELKKAIRMEFVDTIKNLEFEEECTKAINDLYELNVIDIIDGGIILIEELKV